MITAGAIPSLSRLLSLPIGNTMFAVVAKTMGQCAIHQKYYRRFSSLFPRDVLQPLIDLLQSGEAEVSIVAVGAIKGIASGGSKEVLQHLLDEGVVPQLCHLSSKCTNLLVLEKVALAIGRITANLEIYSDEDYEEIYSGEDNEEIYSGEDNEDIKRYVLRPLVDLLGHGKVEVQIRATRALYKLARSRPLVKLWGKTTVLPHIIPLISSDNDELFVEALLSTSRWTYNDNINRTEYMPRLIRLLSCNEDRVMASAALAIGKISFFSNEFFQRVVDLGGIPLFIGLLSSRNMEVIRAAAKTLSRAFAFHVIPDFVGQGVIPSLVNALALAFDSHRVLKAVVIVISDLFDEYGYEARITEDLILAGAIPYFVRLLCLGEDYVFNEDGLIRCVSSVVESSRTAEITFLNAGGAKSLVTAVTSFSWQREGINAISLFIHHSNKSRIEFREAGAESVLSAYLANGPNDGVYDQPTREKATDALKLLRSDKAEK